MLKKIVALTPLFGALTFPLIVPITISKFGVNYGILSALIVYGATEPSAKLTIGGEDVPLAADGTFRIQVPFRDGTQRYDIKAVDLSGEQEKSISMKFDRTTPLDDTNEKDNAETEWF